MWGSLDLEAWERRRKTGIEAVRGAVQDVVETVRREGDAGIRKLTKRFDGVELTSLAVSREERLAAYDEVSPELVLSLTEAKARIERFHELEKDKELWLKEVEPGVTLGVKTTPLRRVGCYVPGGRALYPSTVLMCAVPARVAGVKEVCFCSPPPVSPITLVAMDIAGVDEVYSVGGAQAIAAMALGTQTIRPVQKIVGPGNVYVTAAKMMLRDHAEIDFPAGPSEIVVIADGSAVPEFIAADILAQSEHDPNAASALLTTDPGLPAKVGVIIEKGARKGARSEIMAKSLGHSGYLVVESLDVAVATANRMAPEHLSIQVVDPISVVPKVENAGSVFVGPYSPVACGDYASGTNHVLPTAGFATVYSGLGVWSFCKKSTVQLIDRQGLVALAPIVVRIAEAEGLEAHARSVRVRTERN
jgi:histidinol dehydrogenase